MNDEFLRDLQEMVGELDAGRSKMGSTAVAYGVLIADLSNLWDNAMRESSGIPSQNAIRTDLLRIAANAWRAARDLGLQ
jgi:hypothetical protein